MRRRIVVDRRNRGAHLFIRQREKPSDAAFWSFCEMEPQGLNQHHISDVFCDERAARLRLVNLLRHPLDTPSQGGSIGLFLDMHNRRQGIQQDTGVTASEREVSAGNKAIIAAVARRRVRELRS